MDMKIKKGSYAKNMAISLFIGAIMMVTLPNITLWYMHKAFDDLTTIHRQALELINKQEKTHNQPSQ